MPTSQLRRGPRDKRRETQDEDVHPERVWLRPAKEPPRRAWHDPVTLGQPNRLFLCGWAAVDTLGTGGLGAAHRAGHGKRGRLTGSSGRDGATATGKDAGLRGWAKQLGQPAARLWTAKVGGLPGGREEPGRIGKMRSGRASLVRRDPGAATDPQHRALPGIGWA